MQRVLAFYFARHEEGDALWLAEHASAIRGMVEAGAGEAHVAGYLYRCLRERALPCSRQAAADGACSARALICGLQLNSGVIHQQVPLARTVFPRQLSVWLILPSTITT